MVFLLSLLVLYLNVMETHTDTNIPTTKHGVSFRFGRLYVTTLVALAVLLTAGQVLMQWRIGAAQNEILLVRQIALQRHQSQQIAKKALQLAAETEQPGFSRNALELREILNTFETYHRQTRDGQLPERGITITNSASIEKLFAATLPRFNAFRRGARWFAEQRTPAQMETPAAKVALVLVLDNEKELLTQIDAIARAYNAEVRAKLNQLQTTEFYLYMTTLLVLTVIGLLVFRPAVQQLGQTLTQVIQAEAQTAEANGQLRQANESLTEARRQLYAATREKLQQQSNAQKLRTAYLITGQEEERKRLSRDLHDGLGQMLTAIKLQVEGLETSLSSKVVMPTANITTLKRLISRTIQETRTISNNLMPSVLSDFGVVPALKMLAEGEQSMGVDVSFDTNLNSDDRPDRNAEIALYRVTQEAISNALRHAQPTQITVELIGRDGYLHLIVADDGRGFDPQQSRQLPVDRPGGPSQGLHNMHERVHLLGGRLKIWSRAGQGTKIHITIPDTNSNTQLIDDEYDTAYAG